jgi:hypothetical protein
VEATGGGRNCSHTRTQEGEPNWHEHHLPTARETQARPKPDRPTAKRKANVASWEEVALKKKCPECFPRVQVFDPTIRTRVERRSQQHLAATPRTRGRPHQIARMAANFWTSTQHTRWLNADVNNLHPDDGTMTQSELKRLKLRHTYVVGCRSPALRALRVARSVCSRVWFSVAHAYHWCACVCGFFFLAYSCVTWKWGVCTCCIC